MEQPSEEAPLAPRVAVVVACFNDGATVREAVESVRESEPVELVIVDDGSTDPATLEELDRLRGEGYRVVRQENQGPAAARTAGLHATSARYVMALDADDVQEPGSLSQLADELDADPDIDLVWGHVLTFGEVEIRVVPGDTLDPWSLTYVNSVPADAMARRQALLEVGGWQLRGGYEDWDLWLALAARGRRGKRVPVLTGYYRVASSGRVQTGAIARHGELVDELRRRHATLFRRRSETRRASPAPARVKLLYPLIALLPGRAEYLKHRLYHVVSRPGEVVRARASRRRRAA